jgi:DsbC/DsbD-like thiol-disulfide interchange protein
MSTFLTTAAVLGFLSLVAPEPDRSHWADENVAVDLTVDADGKGGFKAILALDLQPGWKTYWVAPGETGIAPVLDFGLSQDVSVVSVEMPPPVRFGEGQEQAVGYVHPVDVVLAGTISPGAKKPEVRLSLTFGICREVCVPMHVDLVAPAVVSSDPSTGYRIDKGLSFLAEPAKGRFSIEDTGTVLRVSAPTGTHDVFLASQGWVFGKVVGRDGPSGQRWFDVEVIRRPAVPYTSFEVVGIQDDRALRDPVVVLGGTF